MIKNSTENLIGTFCIVNEQGVVLGCPMRGDLIGTFCIVNKSLASSSVIPYLI